MDFYSYNIEQKPVANSVNAMQKNSIYLLFMIILLSGCETPEPEAEKPNTAQRKSPIAIAKTIHQPTNTYIKIVYGQPYRRDRTIFGDLVAYNKVWRTGANEATELTTTKPITIGEKTLKAGTYTLFTIPHKKDQWTIILNNELGQWGAFNYDKSHDVIRVSAEAAKLTTSTEVLSITFEEVSQKSTNIVIKWGNRVVKVPVIF